MTKRRRQIVVSRVSYGTVEAGAIVAELMQIAQSLDALSVLDEEAQPAQARPGERGEV